MAANPVAPNHVGPLQYTFGTNTETAITAAAGGGQSGAYQLAAQINTVATVATAADSVRLPKVTLVPGSLGGVGFMCIIWNNGANALQLFGKTPDTVNGVASATGVSVGARSVAICFAESFAQGTNVGNWTAAVVPSTAGTGTVTSVSVVTANGVSATVTNQTTTPAFTFTLGAITPSSVVASGAVSGSNLSGTNTGDQTITLTGDVTGSGTGSFATAIGANKVTLGMMATGTAGNLITYSAAGAPAAVATGAATQVLTSNGAGLAPTFQAAAAGGARLDQITAATGAATIASGNNTGIVWNWAPTTDVKDAFTLGETSAATGGTITSGIPNQNLVRISTLAASTESPLRVDSRGGHVFSVGSTTRQILATTGSASAPPYSFAANTATGILPSGNSFVIATNGTTSTIFTDAGGNGQIQINQTGLAFNQPQFTEASTANTGLTLGTASGGVVGIAILAIENSRWTGAQGASLYQLSNAGAVTTGYALNFRKSRGSVAAPTVITTADIAHTISGWVYVGATNTWREITRASSVSNGTISDATTGAGGYFAIFSSLQGTDTGPVENVRFLNGSQPISTWQPITFANLGTPTNGSFTYCSDCKAATAIDQTCAGSGNGAFAAYVNAVWKCFT